MPAKQSILRAPELPKGSVQGEQVQQLPLPRVSWCACAALTVAGKMLRHWRCACTWLPGGSLDGDGLPAHRHRWCGEPASALLGPCCAPERGVERCRCGWQAWRVSGGRAPFQQWLPHGPGRGTAGACCCCQRRACLPRSSLLLLGLVSGRLLPVLGPLCRFLGCSEPCNASCCPWVGVSAVPCGSSLPAASCCNLQRVKAVR